MVVDSHWVVPHVNGVVTNDKPPLFFWLIALFSLPAGTVSEVTARLPSVLAGLATIALTMRLGRRWYGPRTAALAGGLLVTTFLFWQKARWSQTDALLCCLIWIALSAFEAFRSETSRGRGAGLIFWLAVALAVLTKGPVGLLLPLGIALVVLAWDHDLGRWKEFAPVTGPLLFAAVIGGWILLTRVAGPPDYSVWGALKEHFIDRGIEGLHHKRPFWYFLKALPPNLMPWTGLIPGGLVLAWRRRLAGERLALTVALFVPLFFSISPEKRELYTLPAFPAFALLAAALVGAVSDWREPEEAASRTLLSRRWATVGHGLVGGFLVLVGVGLAVVSQRNEAVPGLATLGLGAICAATGVGALYYSRRDRTFVAVATTVVGMALVLLVGETFISPTLDRTKSLRPLALRMKEVTAESRGSGPPVVAYRLGNLPEPLAFYSGGVYSTEISDPMELRRHLERPEAALAFVDVADLDALGDLGGQLWVVGEAHLARREVLLLGNHTRPGATPLASSGVDRPNGGQ